MQSEAQLEQKLVVDLVGNGYEEVAINNQNELIENFRKQLYIYNEDKMSNTPFSDKEFERILNHVNNKSIFTSAKILRDKFILERDDNTQVYLEFFNTEHWCKNIFQVTRQTTIVGKYINRYDVTILINGLPLVQIELKRRGLDLKEAFNQIERYRRHSYQGLYRYIQIFIISNGVDTKYFSNTDTELMYSFTFFWSDEKNKKITTLAEFTLTFLDKCQISKTIARYMVINETDKILMVMRPYQIYAVEALINRATETNNNGYIWHTTGSGKTLTSFKTSQILAKNSNIKKVFFLVDRKDLDSQTIREFNKFEPDSVDTTSNTQTLVKQIQDINKSLIVTTIQKMSKAINNYSYVLDKYKDEKVIFIIDECHRSQFGNMHKAINKHFNKAQYFGFTGTPRFLQNKSQDNRVTTDLFEKCLHTYLIKDAIADNNVLGFSVEYIQTFDISIDESDKTKVLGIDTEEVWLDNNRIEMIAKHILDNHNAKTRNRKYTAIFTVQSIPMLIKYYNQFKKLNHEFKITSIYSFSSNEDMECKEEHSRDSLEKIIEDYNTMFDTNYSTDTFNNYFSDVSKKVKTAQIDILIVVNMFLTGFDSKTLNTLYVDKNLEYHNLLQAYSRTNRVEKSTKPYGNIVCYRNLKNNTDEAIKLFSQTQSLDIVLMKNYEYYLEIFKQQLETLFNIVKEPEDVDNIKSEETQKEFILAFRELSKTLMSLQTFIEFEFTKENLGISEQKYADFRSKYLLIHDNIKRYENQKYSILSDIDFSIEIMHTDKINVDYIMNLIRNIDLDNKDKKKKDIEHIIKELERADNQELRLKIELLKEFLNKVMPQLNNNSSIDDAYIQFENEQKEKEIDIFAKDIQIDPFFVKEEIEEYEYSKTIRYNRINEQIKKPFFQKKNDIEKLKNFIEEMATKYQPNND